VKHPAHSHELKKSTLGSGWICDGRPCRGDGGGGTQARYRCTTGCDFDLCQSCLDFGGVAASAGGVGLEGPAGLVVGQALVFKKVSAYGYPAECVDGETVTYLQTNGGTPPAQVQWASGHKYWVEWRDLRVVASPFASRGGCDASCTKSHGGDGKCLACGEGWGTHSGHNCSGGRGRGSWLTVPATSTPKTSAARRSPKVMKVGDLVRVRAVPVAEAKALQEDHGGFAASMATLLGTTGAIERVWADGDITVLGKCWNPALIEVVDSGAAAAGSAAPAARLKVGDRVKLVPNYASFGDAGGGPLKLGDVGTVVADDKDDTPFKVTYGGRSWYYKEGALCHEGSKPTATAVASGVKTHSGEWRGAEKSQWCSLGHDMDGPVCSHGEGIITEEHWSCCGKMSEADLACTFSEASGAPMGGEGIADDEPIVKAGARRPDIEDIKALMPQKLRVGDEVVRGSGWGHGNEDGGFGSVGQVTKTDADGVAPGRVEVKWSMNGKVAQYYDNAAAGMRELYGLGPRTARWAEKQAASFARDEFAEAARRVASIPGLIEVLLDVAEPTIRGALLNVPFVVSALSTAHAAGPWLLKRLKANPDSALQYLDLISKTSDVPALAVPWSNLTMQQDVKSGNVGLSDGTAVAARVAKSKTPTSPRAGMRRQASLEALSAATEAGARSHGGWLWGFVQRGTVDSKPWREVVKGKGGCLLSMFEAKELLSHGALFPGEDIWAPVLLNLDQRKGASRRRKEVPASAPMRKSTAKTAPLDKYVQEKLDWIQIGDADDEPGTSWREKHKSGPPLASVESPGAIVWQPAGALDATADTVWPYHLVLTGADKAKWKSEVDKKGSLISLRMAREIMRDGPLVYGKNAWAPVLMDSELNTDEHIRDLTKVRAVRRASIDRKSLSSMSSEGEAGFEMTNPQRSSLPAAAPAAQLSTVAMLAHDADSTNDREVDSTSPNDDEAFDDAGIAGKRSSVLMLLRSRKMEEELVLNATQAHEDIIDFINLGDLSTKAGSSWRENHDDKILESHLKSPQALIWKPLGGAFNSSQSAPLLEAILDVENAETQKKLLDTAIVQHIMLRSETIGLWIVNRLEKPEQRTSVVTYLKKVSAVAETDIKRFQSGAKAIALSKALAELPDLLPAMLLLPEDDQEAVVSVGLVQRILDAKLADQPVAVLVVLIDLVAVFLVLILFFILTKSRDSIVAGPNPFFLIGLGVCNFYFFAREAYQFSNMYDLGLQGLYWEDLWNLIDVAGVLLMFAALGMFTLGDELYLTDGFRVVAAGNTICIWLKLLGTVKVLNIKLATFVYSLNLIMSDLKEFLFVMVSIAAMFASMFLILHSEDDDGDDDGEGDGGFLNDPRPFQTFGQAGLSVFQMIMGNFEREWFEADTLNLSALSVFLFILFMFFVVIVMLNVLIAVVSDSYDLAMTRAENLFLRTRLELVAELDALGVTRDRQLPAWLIRLLRGSSYVDYFFRLEDSGAPSSGVHGRINHMEYRTRNVVDTSMNAVMKLLADQEEVRRKDVGDLNARMSDLENKVLSSLQKLEKAAERSQPKKTTAQPAVGLAAAEAGDSSSEGSDDDDDDSE